MSTSPAASRRANGVLPISPAQAQSQAAIADRDPPKATKAKAPVEGQKLVIRRLAPGMTEEECLALLGPEWRPGNGKDGKVGWFSFQPGKISNDPAKPSRPSRAYLHVLKSEYTMPLMEHIRSTEWVDAKDTYASSSLVGPPVLELAVYKKVPSLKIRTDARQGTIDQDPEFMDFLEALANPVPNKDPEADYTPAPEEDDKVQTKVSSTPLIDYLREKKANKAKEAAGGKTAKHSRHESQTAKGKATDEAKKKSKDGKSDKTDRPRETVKILTKKAATDAAAEAANTVASQLAAAAAKEESTKSRRAGIAAAARILQRDLGLSPGNAHRRARQEAAKAAPEPSKLTAPASPSTTAPSPTTSATAKESTKTTMPATEGAAGSSQPPTPTAPKAATGVSSRGARGKKGASSGDGPKTKEKKGLTDKGGESASVTLKTPVAILKKKDELPVATSPASAAPSTDATTPSSATTITATKPPPSGPKAASQPGGKAASGGSGSQKKGGSASSQAVSANATRAFVKHANPSQGVTEALLKDVMQTFGSVSFVEIDRRKGFAYVDFADHDGLVKAIAASPVAVAQANVQVLERKETGKKPTTPGAAAATGGEGSGKGGGKGNGASVAPQPPTAPKSSSGGAKTEPAASGSAAPPSGPAAEKAGGGDHKRGGRRRGGRGRGGDGPAKDNKSTPSAPAATAT